MDKIYKAVEIATEAHKTQKRKGTDIPYIVHPLTVGIFLAKAGCSDNVIVAGILHDTVEDTDLTIEDVKKMFGEKIANIVAQCSEPPQKEMDWEERKTHTIQLLENAPIEVKQVIAADKLANLKSISADLEKIGDEVWKKFKRGKEKQKWYYKSILKALSKDLSDKSLKILYELLKKEFNKVFN